MRCVETKKRCIYTSKVAISTKEESRKKLAEMGYSISEFVREKLREVVEETEGEEQI
jgi:antitoxin component of RelBE/YafQ-DinJ toxin-antitoxin module